MLALNLQVYTVPVVNCTRSDSCVECIDYYPNPLCGWCTLEHKCSRQSQCQNSHLAKRYIKEREQCITVRDIHPRHFTVGNSNTVSIHDTGLLIAHIISNFCSVSCTDDWLYVCVYNYVSPPLPPAPPPPPNSSASSEYDICAACPSSWREL